MKLYFSLQELFSENCVLELLNEECVNGAQLWSDNGKAGYILVDTDKISIVIDSYSDKDMITIEFPIKIDSNMVEFFSSTMIFESNYSSDSLKYNLKTENFVYDMDVQTKISPGVGTCLTITVV